MTTPLRMFYKRKEVDMDYKSEIILDLIRESKEMKTTEILAVATAMKLSTVATTHKDLQWLLDHGYIENIPQKDGRIRLYQVSAKGKRYLESK